MYKLLYILKIDYLQLGFLYKSDLGIKNDYFYTAGKHIVIMRIKHFFLHFNDQIKVSRVYVVNRVFTEIQTTLKVIHNIFKQFLGLRFYLTNSLILLL